MEIGLKIIFCHTVNGRAGFQLCRKHNILPPVQGETARKALGLADTAIWHLSAQVNPKITLSVLAAKFRTL